jgi:hypothetical protein
VQEDSRFQSKRTRTILGLAVVGVSLVASASLAGIGFARTSSTSAEQYQYGKATVCHKTGSKKHPFQTITISQNALKAHLKHGDTPGACPTTAPPQNGKDKGKGNGKDDDNGTTTPTQTTPTNGDDNKGQGNNGNGHGKGHGK